MRKLFFLLLAGATTFGCSAKTDNPGGGQTCTTPTACPASSSDLSGTWDFNATSPDGQPITGTISVAKNVFVVTQGDAVLSYVANADGTMTLTWQRQKNDSRVIATQRTAGAFNGGVMPIDLGGTWTFTAANDPQNSCTANVTSGSVSGSCTANQRDWPIFEGPDKGLTISATKTASAASEFGDLGGTWQLADSTGEKPCTVSFQGSTWSISCHPGTRDEETASLTLSDNGHASGKSGSVEYSALRR